MIIKSHPYLIFDGNCLQALERYVEIFDGRIRALQRMGDLRFPMADVEKQRVFHAIFEAGGLYFMACDTFPGHQPSMGANIAQVLYIPEVDKAKRILAQLQDGMNGKLLMPFSETSWSQGYAKVLDPFGIYWDIHVPLEPQQ